MVDAPDLSPGGSNPVSVRFRPSVLKLIKRIKKKDHKMENSQITGNAAITYASAHDIPIYINKIEGDFIDALSVPKNERDTQVHCEVVETYPFDIYSTYCRHCDEQNDGANICAGQNWCVYCGFSLCHNGYPYDRPSIR